MNLETMCALMNSIKDPVVFVDTGHVIRYLNNAGVDNYAKWGGAELIGKSIFDCHNDASCATIREIFAAMQNGEQERLIFENEKKRIFMRAVRADDGQLLGYFERYEWLDNQ